MGHALRTNLIAMELGQRLGLSLHQQRDLYYAALLKDVGCSSNAALVFRLFGGDDRRRRARMLVDWSNYFRAAFYAMAHAAPGASLFERTRRIAGARARPARRVGFVEGALRARRGDRAVPTSGLAAADAPCASSTSTGTAGPSARPARRGDLDPRARAHARADARGVSRCAAESSTLALRGSARALVRSARRPRVPGSNATSRTGARSTRTRLLALVVEREPVARRLLAGLARPTASRASSLKSWTRSRRSPARIRSA